MSKSRSRARITGKARARVRPNRNRNRSTRHPAAGPHPPAQPDSLGTALAGGGGGGAKSATPLVDREFPVDQKFSDVGAGSGSRATIAEDKSAAGLLESDRRYTGSDPASQPLGAIEQATRRTVRTMLADGSLIRGLQAALDVQHTEERAKDAKVRMEAIDRDPRAAFENSARQVGRAVPPPQPVAPKVLRYAEFLDLIDMEIDRTMNLVAGLEDRTRFLQYDGPTADQSGGVNQTSTGPGPVNELESRLYDRANRLSVVRHRLEALHDALRI